MRRASRVLVAAFTLVSAGCARPARAPRLDPDPVSRITAGFDASVRRDVETLRGATARFQDRAEAEAAGYPSALPPCVADSTMGGMGHHFVDRKSLDEKLEIEHPEMLIYAPSGDGGVELVAVEYAVPFRVRPSTEKPPRLFGQELKRYPALAIWALHVWAWRRNPAGLFADWNPEVTC
jgi:hypothetical protein